VTATDHQGAVSSVATHMVQVAKWAVQLQSDPANPGQTIRVLVVGGSTDADTIQIDAGKSGKGLKLRIKEGGRGKWQEARFTGVFDRIVVYGQEGNDVIQVSDRVRVISELHGGPGNDVLKGGGGPSLLVGGDGKDVLIGGKGPGLLIGGKGKDVVLSRAKEDILIGGSTAFDADEDALRAVFAEWTSDADRKTRISHLTGTPGGLNDSYFLNASTVQDDLHFDILAGVDRGDWVLPGCGDVSVRGWW
jgi:Ca2+-binding RTX toxin-like protein